MAQLERGAGNASVLVLRQIAEALSIEVAALVTDRPERPIDLTLAILQLERLAPIRMRGPTMARRCGMSRRSMGNLGVGTRWGDAVEA